MAQNLLQINDCFSMT